MPDVYLIDPLNEKCRICERRIGIVDPFVPARDEPGIVHVRCASDAYDDEEEDE